MKYLFIIFLFASCLQQVKKEDRELDRGAQEVQRLAFWHRQYYLEVLKWTNRNKDSAEFYQYKADSLLDEYKAEMRRYDSLSKIYKQ
jgi:hypothetical protein